MLGVSVSAGGDILVAQVRGNGRVYQTMLHISRRSPQPVWTGTCSCPVGKDCKHVVALLLPARAQALDDDGAAHWQDQLDRLLHVSQGRSRAMALEVAEDPRG